MKVFELTPRQAQGYLILTHPSYNHITELGYGGGAGGGKSILGCVWEFDMCKRYPGVAYALGRKELVNLKKTTLLSFFQVVNLLGLESSKHFTLNSQTNIITFENGSQIFLVDMAYQPSDPLYTRFGGLELTGAFVDESNENNQQGIEILKTRLGRRKNKEHGLVPKLLETFNPDKGHVYKRYFKPWKEGRLPKNRMFIPALATDNPYLDASYIEQLRNADKITRERLLYGNFDYDDNPAKLFEYDKILDIFVNDYNLPSKYQNYISCDVARFGADKTVIIIWNGYYVQKIITINKSSVKEVVERLEWAAAYYKVPRSNVIIDEDGVGGGVVDFMPNAKGFVNNSTPVETEFSKKIHNYRNLKTQCYFKLAEIILKGQIRIYDDVPLEIKEGIVEDLEQIAQKNIDKDGKIELVGKDEIKEKLGRSTDYSDALMMRCWFDLKSSYRPYIAK